MTFTEKIPHVCCVYKITNVISNLILIGSTIDLNKRVDHYRNDIKKKNPLKHYNRKFLKDIITYGINSFTIEIIEECDKNINNISLKNKESKYILQYNSINPKIGYNLRLDIDGKYICNSSTKSLKSEQTKIQWAFGIRNNHSEKLKNYWNKNEDRRLNQAEVMRNNLTKYVYTVRDAHNNILHDKISYNKLAMLGLKCAATRCSQHKINYVISKGYIVERIIKSKI